MSELNKITRMVLRNYKSIRECDVPLGPITFLVGPNGAGKSNFVEALRFLSYGLSNSLEQAKRIARTAGTPTGSGSNPRTERMVEPEHGSR